ncbi:hypothetical protein FB45DRAFT_913452 [Roridomyces roridus]|uniref:DUF3074 domain-containing protein n=1 Tax=Roridomyces roridus TaxID=1738132 RepID=A0AAD7BX24_9AGAR|nr:hypothetical protein FB45DRAFT_913452 [Roridomyces roridus]
MLNITPIKPTDIPNDDQVMSAADEVLASTLEWAPGKTFHGNVKTCSRPKAPGEGAAWHCRVSIHKTEEVTFDKLWEKLGKDKAVNEKEFIPDINKVTKVKEISPTQMIWTLHYKFSPPISPRVFTVVQITRLSESSPRTGTVVSIPIDLSEDPELAKLEEKGVRGRYVSVERITELEDGTIEWRMATSSTPGGSIPTYFVEKSMDGKIAEDVPHFMAWYRREVAKI